MPKSSQKSKGRRKASRINGRGGRKAAAKDDAIALLAKNLIAQIESAGPDDEYYDAKVSVLSEMIKHHVNEEGKRGGMFTKARQSDMDLKALGERLQTRRAELMREEGGSPTRRRGMAATLLSGGSQATHEAARRT